MKEFFEQISAAIGLPIGLTVVVSLLAVGLAGFIFSLFLELVFGRNKSRAPGPKAGCVRENSLLRNGSFIVTVERRSFTFSRNLLTDRSNLTFESDREKLERICKIIATGFLLFEADFKDPIGNRWDPELYRKVDLQDPTHSDATIQFSVLGHHHRMRDDHVVTLQTHHMADGDEKEAKGTVAHEFLHEYILYSQNYRQLGEGVTEYLSRLSAGLRHHACHGSYQSSVDIVGALVKKLRHGQDTLVSCAVRNDGLAHEINSRLYFAGDSFRLDQIFGDIPHSVYCTMPSKDDLLRFVEKGDCARALNLLMVHAYKLESKADRQLRKVVEIAQQFIDILSYREDASNTIIFPRKPNDDGPKASVEDGSKTTKQNKFLLAAFSFLTGLVNAGSYLWNRKFWKLSGKKRQRLVIIAIGVLVLGGFSYLFVSWYLGPDKVKKAPFDDRPIVMNRSNLTPEQFEKRKSDIKKYIAQVALFSHQETEGVPSRFKQYWPVIRSAAKARGVYPQTIASLAFQESFFDPTAYNTDTKASGMFQFMESTAALSGLVVDRTDFRLRKDGKDFRQEPVKSSLSASELYRQALQRWGDEDMAVWDHHAGTKIPGQAMKSYLDETHPGWENEFGTMAKAMKALKIGYWDLRLRPTPTFAPKTWELMMGYLSAKHDYTGDYPMRVETAKSFVNEMVEGNFDHFNQTFALYKATLDKFHLQGEAGNKEAIGAAWWTWYANLDRAEFVPDCQAMAKVVKSGKWVKVPNDLSNTGFLVDKSMGVVNDQFLQNGESNHNSDHVKNHQYTLPEVVGTALWLTAWYKEVYLQEGKTYEPITISSLGRNLWFQDMLTKMGSTAATDQLPLHTAGLAFDVAMGRLSPEAVMRWKFVINEARSMGMISVSEEGPSKNTHVVPSPQWREFFSNYYHTRVK